MENKELDCGIVRDLLPSYADGLTGERSNAALEAHLALCPDCAAALSRMREQAETPPTLETAQRREVDYLKKVRRRTRRWGALLGLGLLLLGMALLCFRFFYVGVKAAPETLACHVVVEGDTVYLRGTLTSSGLGVARAVFTESAGVVEATVYVAPVAFFNSGDFTASYRAQGPVEGVRCGKLFLWAEGTAIGSVAARLYAAATPFTGDASALAGVASVLDVAGQLGPFANALQTDTEPYGWTLRLEQPLSAGDDAAAQDVMTADAYAMLAVVGNLGSVTWQYEVSGAAMLYTVTAEDASSALGRDVKGCGASPAALQQLLAELSLRWAGVK